MGQPSGGSTLGEVVECRVYVTHDVLSGKIDFEKTSLTAHQTSEEIKIPIRRSQFTSGDTLNLILVLIIDFYVLLR